MTRIEPPPLNFVYRLSADSARSRESSIFVY